MAIRDGNEIPTANVIGTKIADWPMRWVDAEMIPRQAPRRAKTHHS